MTSPLSRCHFDSLEATNWSMITWAPFAEVAELRLPEYQRERGIERKAPFEAEDRCLRQQAVNQLQPRLVLRQRAQGREALAGASVVERGVPLAEGAAPAVLAGKAHRRPFQQERAERQRLGEGP